ncbi:AraC family transcriptional regulator [Nitratireductor sp. GISD-1A_MAKvit]|uniref:helix-turn-helix domain-containing protein n=1 Tax=Nitratireductor sp. GISD-1A_MAKvit TaxID=3234198 RepID=UPI00346599FB
MLLVLAADEAAMPLADTVAARELDRADRERIDRVLLHIHMNYAAGISNGELAEIAALSQSGLHRLFCRHMRCSISDYVMRLRIGEACARLSSGDQPIGHVAEAVGYHTLANFNRQFKALRGMTPRAYRALFRG